MSCGPELPRSKKDAAGISKDPDAQNEMGSSLSASDKQRRGFQFESKGAGVSCGSMF